MAGGEASGADVLSLADGDAPQLHKDPKIWDALPAEKYEAVIIDPVSAFAVGVTEKEGKETMLAIETLKRLAARGPGVLAVLNATKDSKSYRGRGEWEMKTDIFYEVRDATGHEPGSGKDWFESLPEDSAENFVDRAKRRGDRTVYRLAFLCTKYRGGITPPPFCLELDLSGEEWFIRDITSDLEATAKDADTAKEEKDTQREEEGCQALSEAVADRAATDNPLTKTEAQDWLTSFGKEKNTNGITQKRARLLVMEKDGVLWDVVDGEQPQQGGRRPKVLNPLLTISPTVTRTTRLTMNKGDGGGGLLSPLCLGHDSNSSSQTTMDKGVESKGVAVVGKVTTHTGPENEPNGLDDEGFEDDPNG